MALHPDGQVVGSVSGGCVEGAVVEVATEVLETGVPQRVRYGISDDEAFAVGLTCGGTIEVLVQTLAPEDVDLDALADALDADTPIALAIVADGDHAGTTVLVRPDGIEGTTGD